MADIQWLAIFFGKAVDLPERPSSPSSAVLCYGGWKGERTGPFQMIRLILRILRLLLRAFLELVMGVLILIGFSPALVGMAIIGFQFFVWLVTESWTPIPLADALEVIRMDPRFLDHLQVWEGLAAIIRFWLHAIPLSSCFLVAGFILSGFMAYIRWSLLDIFEQNL